MKIQVEHEVPFEKGMEHRCLYPGDFDFLLKFAEESFIGEEVVAEQFRALWTAYCLHHGLDVDTKRYDDDLRELWQAVSQDEEDTQNWSDFDSFDRFMCAWLV